MFAIVKKGLIWFTKFIERKNMYKWVAPVDSSTEFWKIEICNMTPGFNKYLNSNTLRIIND